MDKGIRKQEGKIVIIDEEKAEFNTLVSTLPDAERKRLREIKELTLYPVYEVGTWYEAGEVLSYAGHLYKVIQPHTSQADWEPDKTPALYVSTLAEGEIGEWAQPAGAHDAYNTGDKVLFEGKVYESLIDANVWSPSAYPQGWKLVD